MQIAQDGSREIVYQKKVIILLKEMGQEEVNVADGGIQDKLYKTLL